MLNKPSVIAASLVGRLLIAGILLWKFVPGWGSRKPGDPSVIKAPVNPVANWNLATATKQAAPEISKEDIATYYSKGKTVRSICYLNMTGEGTNTNLILKGTTHFAYQHRIAAETKVKENHGTRVVFEQHFKEVMQTRAFSDQKLELNPPSLSASPIISMVWSELDQQVLSNVPVYRAAKTCAAILNGVDPNLKWTLTLLTQLPQFQWLKRAGVLPTGNVPLEIAIKVNQLQGQRLEIEYVSGRGVTYIKVLGGKQLDHDLLEHLAYRSSVLMDYVIGEEAKAADGKQFSVPFKQIRGLCGLEYDIDGDGELLLQKDPASPASEGLTRLTITGGKVTISAIVEGVQRIGDIWPATQGSSDQNYVLYSEAGHLVRRAMANWNADFDWFTGDNLLFGTRNLTHVRMTSYYEAEIAPTTVPETAGT